MRRCLLFVATGVLVGCGSTHERVVVAGTDPVVLTWASELTHASPAARPALARSIRAAARHSDGEVASLSLLDQPGVDSPIPVVVLQVDDPAEFLAFRLKGFLTSLGYFRPTPSFAFVEVLDRDAKFVWAAGKHPYGGMVKTRPELDACSPIVHSRPSTVSPPPCPVEVTEDPFR